MIKEYQELLNECISISEHKQVLNVMKTTLSIMKNNIKILKGGKQYV